MTVTTRLKLFVWYATAGSVCLCDQAQGCVTWVHALLITCQRTTGTLERALERAAEHSPEALSSSHTHAQF